MGITVFNILASSTVQVAAHRVTGSWEWYVLRAAGFVAAALLLLLMISGIGQVTGLTYRFIEPVKAWKLHKAMAISLCVAIAIHVVGIIADDFMTFTIPQVFVPYLSHYNNGSQLFGLAIGSLAISFGIMAMYGVGIIVASSLGWINSKPKYWRWIHYISYAVIIDVFLHGLYVGTDLKSGILRFIWIGFGLVLIIAIISRLLRAGTLNRKK